MSNPNYSCGGAEEFAVVEDLLSLCPFAHRLITPSLRPELDAMDLIQECLVRLQPQIKKLAAMARGARLACLQQRLRQLARDWRRSRQRQRKRLETKARSGGVCQVDLPDCDRLFDCVRKVLNSLSPKNALLVELVFIQGWKVSEAAKRLGITPERASWRLNWFKMKAHRLLRG
jgi:RNA polymerase sigma factor (sigma-70 family)